MAMKDPDAILIKTSSMIVKVSIFPPLFYRLTMNPIIWANGDANTNGIMR